MLSKRSQSTELAGMVTNAVQKLQLLDHHIKNAKCEEEPSLLQSSVKEVIDVMKEMECERLQLYELLETETIKASVLRYKLQYLPGDIQSELQVAVSSARRSNEAEIKRLKDQLNTIKKSIVSLEKRQKDLDSENSRLKPVRDDMQMSHDEIIALLNQRMADKASKQINLNETRDKLRETYKRIIDLEDSIVQLKEDLVHERDDASEEKETLRQSVRDTQKKVEEQRTTNTSIRGEIDKLQEVLVDSESALDVHRKMIRQLETSRSRLEAQEVQLNRQLQKEIRDNSQLTQEGMKVVKEHAELAEKLENHRDKIAEGLQETRVSLVEKIKVKVYANEDESISDIKVLAKQKKQQLEEGKLNAEKEELSKDLERTTKEREKDAEVVRDFERKLLRAKENLAQQNAECARMKRENVELEFEVEQLKESHQATVESFNKQIEESRSSLNVERKDRQVLQTKRDVLTKESNEFKSDYGKYMASMSKKVTEGKVEHARLTSYGTQLQNDLKQDEVDIISKQKQLKRAKQDYTSLQKKLKAGLKTLQESLDRLEKQKTEKKDVIEDKTPIYKDLEVQFKECTDAYEKTKKNIVDLKNKKASLETSVQRAEKEVEKMAAPQTQLREQLRECRTRTLEQLKTHSQDVQSVEKDIFTSGQKLGAVLRENHKLKEAIKKVNVDLKTIDWHVGANINTKQNLDQRLHQYRDSLHKGWYEDLMLDKVYAEKDIKILDDIALLQREAQTREERIDVIHSQLVEQLIVLSHFLDGISSLRPKGSVQSDRKGSTQGKESQSEESQKNSSSQ